APDFLREYRVVFVGDGAVGKSCVVIQVSAWVLRYLIDTQYEPTIKDSYRKQRVVDDQIVLLMSWTLPAKKSTRPCGSST
ncbi:hypothetical protein K469DRAFT_761840, partial [Zopfia rhizophila CBS 207.26]